jgi:hypothetical protein
MLGNACIFTRENEKAVPAFAKLFNVVPDSAAAHLMTARMMLHREVDGETAKQASRALEPDARIPRAHYRPGDAYSRREDRDNATAPPERPVWLNPNYPAPFILPGRGYPKRKEPPNANGVLRHALKPDRQNLSAHYLPGQTLLQEGKIE